MTPPSFDSIAIDLARRQCGVLTRHQLLGAGVHRSTIERRVRSGVLQVVHRGVYRLGPVEHPHGRLMAAVLACGPGAWISHRSAGRHWAILPDAARAQSGPIDVITSGRRCVRSGIELRRSSTLDAGEVTLHAGIPVTTPIRTLCDLASCLRPGPLEKAAAEAIALRLIRPEDLRAAVHRWRRRPGADRLRGLVGETEPARIRSTAEDRLLSLIRRAGVPSPEVNVRIGRHEVDFHWPDERLVVEVDGRSFHTSPLAFERDRRRDAELAARGIRVMRVTWRQLTRESEAVLVRLGAAPHAHAR